MEKLAQKFEICVIKTNEPSAEHAVWLSVTTDPAQVQGPAL